WAGWGGGGGCLKGGGCELPAGPAYAYHATSAHWVMAEIVERLSGMDFREFFRVRVAEPPRAHGAEWRAPEHRSREAQRAACRSAAGGRRPPPPAAASAGAEGAWSPELGAREPGLRGVGGMGGGGARPPWALQTPP